VAKNFRQFGIPFDCLEREDDVGGNWYYGRPHSSVYRSTRLISSKRLTEYTDFPMPANWPAHPGQQLVGQYLRDYARHFDLYAGIEFGCAVSRIERSTSDGREAAGWIVTLESGEQRLYHGVVIANGHNWDPRWPNYPGRFDGAVLHSANYKVPEVAAGRRVLVVGGGNSGFDIATDVADHADVVFHSLRRHYHVLPRFNRGTPIDESGEWMLRWRLPLWLRRLAKRVGQQRVWTDDALAVLPAPDHRLLETHPVINSRWPYDVARGAVRVKPDLKELGSDSVTFVDGSREPIDLIVCATGYRISFPFIDREELHWRNGKPELYLNIFHPERDDLFVAGLIQPDSGQFGLVDYQAQLIAKYLAALSQGAESAARFQRQKRDASRSLNGGVSYVRTPRHLLEVEHFSYRRHLQAAIRRL
jgi:cation diffusion facilitator CzcD-associated flavoprotein CzcO